MLVGHGVGRQSRRERGREHTHIMRMRKPRLRKKGRGSLIKRKRRNSLISVSVLELVGSCTFWAPNYRFRTVAADACARHTRPRETGVNSLGYNICHPRQSCPRTAPRRPPVEARRRAGARRRAVLRHRARDNLLIGAQSQARHPTAPRLPATKKQRQARSNPVVPCKPPFLRTHPLLMPLTSRTLA